MPAPAEFPPGPLVALASFNAHQDAELVLSLLASQGIVVIKTADDCGGTDPRLSFSSRVTLLVPESQAEEARAYLNEAESAP